MEINGYIIGSEIEELMTARGIKQVDVERLTASPNTKHFISVDGTLGVAKCYMGVNTYYLEYRPEGNQKVVTDAYSHWIAVESDT